MKNSNKVILTAIIILTSICAQAQSSVTVVRRLPRESTVVVHSGVRYRYSGGVYYKPYGRHYTIVRPPVGLTVTLLPVGYTRVTIGSALFFYAAGVYYSELSPGKYQVVSPPKEQAVKVTELSGLPEGAQCVSISGKKYYKVNDTFYEKLISENGVETFAVVGGIE